MDSVQKTKETISLALDEENELTFKVQIEGADAPAKVRLVCECDDVSYMFYGGPSQDGKDLVEFTIPQMKGKVKDNQILESRIEVLVGNKYFVPVEFDVNFKQSTVVVVESVKQPNIKKKLTETSVTSGIISVKSRVSEPVEQKATIEESRKTIQKNVNHAKRTLHERYVDRNHSFKK